LIDLPKKSDDPSSQGSKTTFYEELVYFLKAMTLHENVISKLDGFDFSKTARYAFVHTVYVSNLFHSGAKKMLI
jgi:hypothetical protein